MQGSKVREMLNAELVERNFRRKRNWQTRSRNQRSEEGNALMRMSKRCRNALKRTKSGGKSEQTIRSRDAKNVPMIKLGGALKMKKKMDELVKCQVVNNTRKSS